MPCNLFPHLIIAGIFHIAVNLVGILVFQKADNGIFYLIGHRSHRISQTEIIDIFLAVLLGHFLSQFKHLSNRGISL